MSERERFEAEMKSWYGPDVTLTGKDSDGKWHYMIGQIQARWELWQAATKAERERFAPFMRALKRLDLSVRTFIEEWESDDDDPQTITEMIRDLKDNLPFGKVAAAIRGQDDPPPR